ncbi:MAG: hypothetical protein JSR36_08555 [Proteobacteria bacterium]|nr:hypothetical protein [Pseudomonadota bacterium]
MSDSRERFWISLAVAILLGILQTYLLLLIWGYISAYTPVPKWLLTHGLKGRTLHSIVFLVDLATSLVLCLPLAYALCTLRPTRLPVYLLAALLPGFIWQYRLFLTDASLLHDVTTFVPGVVLWLLPLPLAATLIKQASFVRTPNNRWSGRDS